MPITHLIHLPLSKIIQLHSPFTISLNRDKFQHVQTLPKPQHLSEGQRWCQSFLMWPSWLFGVGTEELECLRSPCVRRLWMLVGSSTHCGSWSSSNTKCFHYYDFSSGSCSLLTLFSPMPLPSPLFFILPFSLPSHSLLFHSPPFLFPSSPSHFHLFPLPLDPTVSL